MYAPGMGCDRESRPEYDTINCPRDTDKMQDGRVPDKREVLNNWTPPRNWLVSRRLLCDRCVMTPYNL